MEFETKSAPCLGFIRIGGNGEYPCLQGRSELERIPKRICKKIEETPKTAGHQVTVSRALSVGQTRPIVETSQRGRIRTTQELIPVFQPCFCITNLCPTPIQCWKWCSRVLSLAPGRTICHHDPYEGCHLSISSLHVLCPHFTRLSYGKCPTCLPLEVHDALELISQLPMGKQYRYLKMEYV